MMFLGNFFPIIYFSFFDKLKKQTKNNNNIEIKHNTMNKNTNLLKWMFSLLVICILGFYPSIASAANLFTIPSGDISLKVLGSIFGGLLDSGVSTGGADPMLAGIKAFNGGVLIIGGVLAAYTILAGTLGTAHDGEMLGKKFSSVWIPIRYSVGTALVLPVVSGGYCVMQAIVMWLVVQGIGLADTVWTGFVSNPTSAANTGGATNKDFVLEQAKSAFSSAMCVRSYARAVEESDSLLNWGTHTYSITKTDAGYRFGDSSSWWRTNGCGEVLYPKLKGDTTIKNSTPSTNSGYLGNIGTIFTPIDVSPILAAHKTATDALVTGMDLLAQEVLATAPKGGSVSLTKEQAEKYYGLIELASYLYMSSVQNAANNLGATDAFEAIKTSASDQGWILAGAWFTRIIQMNNLVNSSVRSTLISNSNTPHSVGDSYIFSDAKKYMDGISMVMSGDVNSNSNPAGSENKKDEDISGKKIDATGGLNKAEAAVTKVLTNVNLYELKNDSRHPLIIIAELGNRLITVTISLMSGLIAGLLGAGVVAVITGSSGLLSALVQLMGWFVEFPIKLLMGAAMGCAYIIPNMPYVIWIGCITGWILLVIEAIIAAPLWAIMHLHPGGDDLTGRGSNGYSLVLSLLLRPVFMIFGMEASIVISSVIGEFINKTYFEVFAQNTDSFTGWTSLLSLAMGTTFYFIIMFIFIRKCFGLLHQLPDQLLQWIGGGGASLGQFAGEFSSAADKGGSAAAALGGFGASASAKLGNAGAQKLGSALKDRKDNANSANQQSAESIDSIAGKGASATKNSFSSMRAGQNSKKSQLASTKENQKGYDSGMAMAVASDSDNGRSNFESQFAASEANGHQDYEGNAGKAAYSIGQSIASNNIANSPHSSYLNATSVGENGAINTRALKSAQGTFSKMSTRIGEQAASKILNDAAAGGGSPTEVHDRAEKMYSAVKSEKSATKTATDNTDSQ